ncbi:MAG: baseplate J/gp47 family protein [Treponema sp.]|jgi:hypothetical protein|nr:baseplate J/gp47 family protein [Treponema sp.]
MPYNVPSTQELVQRNLSQLESSLNQTTPQAEKAFNNVLATAEGMAGKELYSYAADLIRENFALTASEKGLEKMGEEYGIPRVQSAAWEGKAHFDLPDGKTLYLGTVFIGPHNLKYETTSSVTAPYDVSGSGVIVAIACADGGPSGNLSADNVLTIQTPMGGGAGRTLQKIETTKLGTPIEDLELFRQRILDYERSEGGGGNSSDYRSWAQAVPGVRRAYPFTGPPEDSDHDPLPGERTVYVECLPNINEQGVPPQPLLDLVWAAMLADPDTGVSRLVMGLTSDTLYVKPVVRIGLYINIIGMAVSTGNIGDAETAVRLALESFLEGFCPFVPGLDPDFDKRDEVTASVIDREVQNALDVYGGTAQGIRFGTSPETHTGKYILKRNEKVSLAGIVFQKAEE